MTTLEKYAAEVRTKMLQRAMEVLDGMGCKYAIVTQDGEKFGTLDIAEPKPVKKKNPPAFPVGELINYVRKHIGELQPGQVAMIPADKYGIARVQASACNWMSEKYGVGRYTSRQMPDDDVVLIEFHNGLGS